MIEVAGVRFKRTGKIYYFDPIDIDLELEENVIVETIRGLEFGTLKLLKEVDEDSIKGELKPVIRVATEEDENINVENRNKAREAIIICEQKIKEHNLDMKLISCEYTFDRSKLLFYFTADGRIDFRELVRDLAAIFKTRIELRQIGVRDEAKLVGGLGCCGRATCCSTFLSEFSPVSIKMAKDQNLSLNPSKISGICGRLMCCLKYEQDGYECINKLMPRPGEIVKTKRGRATVMDTYTIQELVKVFYEVDDGKEVEYLDISDLRRTREFNKTFINESKSLNVEEYDESELVELERD
ncbi:stage 0 sporulation family protein [Peptoniphilus sp. MSJ-1]|uniref:Stage 0 sporulation family protein n=1 Tax=Peptoniphilus ovalis TaxID=2841503 RepID=A0ABS6FI51_9FIRM|nr:stage 0 sporulation family protein [Peptoniphilus ovalis]MBU5669848.1 stage 0 sporulation family protein [Peptoniphilus ovalis]